jgi:hypothetical protein
MVSELQLLENSPRREGDYMADYFEDGSVLLSFEEMQQLDHFTAKVGILKSQFEVLKNQHDLLKGLHQYAILCKDAFEQDNIKLQKQIENLETQIKADQYSQFRRILVEEDQLHTML